MNKATILIVDDEPANLSALSQLLNPYYRVRACRSGEEALQSARRDPKPDLILLDIMMPGMSGYTVLNRLKEDERTRDIPVIFVTVLDTDLNEEKGLQLGAVDYISKPISPAIVLQRVRTHLELKQARDRLKEQNLSLEAEVVQRILENRLILEEKELLECQLSHAQKLEAIGTLAGGIVHDFNNILAPIIGYTEMVHEDLAESDASREDLEQVLAAARRAKDLVSRILHFTRLGGERQKQPTIVEQIVKEALVLMRAVIPKTIEIQENLESGAAIVDETQVHQVVVNLCTNAAHAMNNRGVLSVSLQQRHIDEEGPGKAGPASLSPGPYLELCVSDTGQGMTPQTADHIFEPFFTTKEEGKGTGLGLSVVRNIVRRHGGDIFVQSEPGKGSAFYAYFPMVADESLDVAPLIEDLPRGTERILVVDDEPMIADLCSRLLERRGYQVISHTDPKEALAWFHANSQALDLLIVDYTMPQMTGVELAQEVFKTRPDMPVVLCTGINACISQESLKAQGITEVAAKPFEKGILDRLIRKALAAKRSADQP